MEELTTPYYIFKEAGYNIEIASIRGGKPAVDPASLSSQFRSENVVRFENDEEAFGKFENALKIDDIVENGSICKFGGIFLCGGHGAVDDFFDNIALKRAIEYMYSTQNGCVAAVCHGTLALVRCLHEGKPLLKDKFVAAFSNEEEGILGLQSLLPLLTETLVDEAGAICVPSSPW
jgi:putative intracellular protease/amidase